MDGLVLCTGGMLRALDALRASWLPSLLIGLYANDWTPEKTSTISEVVPAWFSGNTVLHNLPGWGTPYLDGDIGVTDATERQWSHDGGPISSWVFGYYVVDTGGALVWAERTLEFGMVMYRAGQEYRVTPRFAQGTRYPT
jgi:hypothetical protein